MANGIQRTPFDTIDLGSQLLQALVSAQQTKGDREKLKLQEKQLSLQEKSQQLEALKYADPMQQGFGDILSQLVGAPVQPAVSPQQQEYHNIQDYLGKNPDVKDMYMRLQTTGTILPGAEALQGAQIAAGLKGSFKDRAAAVGQLLEQMGSPAVDVWNRAIGRGLGVQAPTGVKTLPERAVGAEEKRAKAAAGTEEAARIRARQDATEFIAGGFQPLPNSPAAQDPTLARQYADELMKFAMGEQDVVSPEAITQMVPLAKWSAILKASAEPSPEFTKRLALYKEMLDYANKSKGKVPKETLQQIQDLGQSLYDEALPPTKGEAAALQGESFAAGALGKMLGFFVGTPEQGISLNGRPLKPELQQTLDLVAKGMRATSPLGAGKLIGEATLGLLDKAYQKVLPLISTEPTKPPVIPPTLGALSSPEASSIPPDAKSKLQGLVAAYRAAGATDEEASGMEDELLQIIKSGDEKAQKEYIQAVLEDIADLKKGHKP